MDKNLPVTFLYISSNNLNTELTNKLSSQYVHFETCSSSIDAIQFLQTNQVAAVLVEHPASPINTQDTVSYLREEINSQVQVFIYNYDEETEGSLRISGKNTILSNELDIEKFLTLINRSQTGIESKSYGLDYLKEISDNNEDFIIQSIHIFIQSVKENLEMAESALLKKEYDEIRDIAHAIKPSFEILENKDAAPVCDKLIYDQNPEKMSFQLSELKRIYEQMAAELIKFLGEKYDKDFKD